MKFYLTIIIVLLYGSSICISENSYFSFLQFEESAIQPNNEYGEMDLNINFDGFQNAYSTNSTDSNINQPTQNSIVNITPKLNAEVAPTIIKPTEINITQTNVLNEPNNKFNSNASNELKSSSIPSEKHKEDENNILDALNGDSSTNTSPVNENVTNKLNNKNPILELPTQPAILNTIPSETLYTRAPQNGVYNQQQPTQDDIKPQIQPDTNINHTQLNLQAMNQASKINIPQTNEFITKPLNSKTHIEPQAGIAPLLPNNQNQFSQLGANYIYPNFNQLGTTEETKLAEQNSQGLLYNNLLRFQQVNTQNYIPQYNFLQNKEKINKDQLRNYFKPDSIDLSKLKQLDSVISNVKL
jgi:hypothetical protein